MHTLPSAQASTKIPHFARDDTPRDERGLRAPGVGLRHCWNEKPEAQQPKPEAPSPPY